jgi:Uma2 family endonuclease
MAPPGSPHQVIAGNLAGEMYAATTRNRPGCRVRPQAGIAPRGLRGRDHFEADIVVSCTPIGPDEKGIIADPIVIVEILSPGTGRDDIFVKLPSYKELFSVREILYVETGSMAATIHRRDARGGWIEEVIKGPEAALRLETIGLAVPVSVIYEGAFPVAS